MVSRRIHSRQLPTIQRSNDPGKPFEHLGKSRANQQILASFTRLVRATLLESLDRCPSAKLRATLSKSKGVRISSSQLLAIQAPCGHNDHMKHRVVGARELKVRLGTYLRQVRQGRTLVVTDRGQPVAELRPIAEDTT